MTERTPHYFTEHSLDKIKPLEKLSPQLIKEMHVVSKVLPFRVNDYVIDHLIDWNNIPHDPIFQLTFPQKGMLTDNNFLSVYEALYGKNKLDHHSFVNLVNQIRQTLNPHPSMQLEMNIATLDGQSLDGVQHKYDETVLFFPGQGQTCHAYCTFCFRWAQFIGDKELRIASTHIDNLVCYLKKHRKVTDIIFTGGDPMVMNWSNFEPYIDAILSPELAHIRNIRIGTKSLTYWPYRYLTDSDTPEVLKGFERIVQAGKHLAIMAHYNHWQELESSVSRQAIAAIQGTGAIIRAQGPLLRHINDDPEVWTRLWKTEVDLGIIPYYMFVERDTGARNYFEVPLVEAWSIFKKATQNISGLARTVRGPVMSATPGKVEVLGVIEINGKKYFVLRLIQSRNADETYRPFFAEYSESASWLTQLKPAFGEEHFFFEKG